MRRARWLASALVVVALVAGSNAPARADDDDLLSSLYTESGYELRRDERLFALLAAFNVAGFDRAEELRVLPFPRRAFHPIRQSLRDALDPQREKLRGQVNLFLDTHPESVDAYETAALALGAAPDFKPSDAFPSKLAGLDKMLADFAKSAKLAKLSLGLATEYRAEFKRLRDVLDDPFAKLRAAYRLKEDDAPSLVLMPTPLDGPQSALALHTADNTHVVVFGLPAEGKVDPLPALKAYSKLLAREATDKAQPEGVKDAIDALKAANVLPADFDASTVLTESLRFAVEAKLWSKDAAAAADLATKKGFVFTRELLKALDEAADAFPPDKGPFALQAASRVDLKKAVADLVPAPPPASNATQATKTTGGRK